MPYPKTSPCLSIPRPTTLLARTCCLRLTHRLPSAGAIETFEADKEVYLVMKLCTGGDLHMRAPYSEKAAADIVSKVR